MLRLIIVLVIALPWGEAALRAEDFVFGIFREGAHVGGYRFSIEEEQGRRVVAVDMTITIRVLLVPIYVVRHHRRETWDGDRLMSAEGTSSYNLTGHEFRFWRNEERGFVRANGETEELSDPIITLVPWRPAISGKATLLTEKGNAQEVVVSAEGRETVTFADLPVEAGKYLLTGRKKWEVWYDADGRLLLVRYDNHGSTIEIRREKPEPIPRRP